MSGIIGINLHGIGTPERDLEPGEAPYWISESQYDDLLDQIAASSHRDRIRITFDDGNMSDLTHGLPGLLARGLRADFFVLTGRLDQPGSLGVQDLRTLQEAGMGLGSHGIDHVNWAGIEPVQLEQELTRSRAVLSDLLGGAVTQAAIPFGLWNGRVLTRLKVAGYTTAWSSDGGLAREDAFLRPRTSVQGAMTSATFARLVAGHHPLKARARRMVGMTLKHLRR